MTYQYARLAVGRKAPYRDAFVALPCDEHGNVLIFESEEEEAVNCWTRKVIGYEIKDKVMYCRLEGIK